MKRLRILSPLLVVVAILAGCGGGSHHHSALVHKKAVAPASQQAYHTPYGVQPHAPSFGLPPTGASKGLTPSATATGEMVDTVTLSTVPSNPFAVAGYTSGFWPTFLPLVHAFPNAYHVSIAINVLHAAQCLDVEPGDAVPSQAGAWVLFDRAHGFAKPCLYASLRNGMPEVEANLAAVLGSTWRSQVFLWDADWTYIAHLDSGFDATQWTDHAFNRNLDESTVTLAFIGSAPKPPGPSHEQVLKWQRGRNASLRAYHGRHCTKPALGPKDCRIFGNRVVYFVQQLDAAKVQTTPRCWGKHADLTAAACQIVRPRVSIRSRARSATTIALQGHGCNGPVNFPVTSHSSLCENLRHRERFFNDLVNTDRKAFA